jgi:hypothetical protein
MIIKFIFLILFSFTFQQPRYHHFPYELSLKCYCQDYINQITSDGNEIISERGIFFNKVTLTTEVQENDLVTIVVSRRRRPPDENQDVKIGCICSGIIKTQKGTEREIYSNNNWVCNNIQAIELDDNSEELFSTREMWNEYGISQNAKFVVADSEAIHNEYELNKDNKAKYNQLFNFDTVICSFNIPFGIEEF